MERKSVKQAATELLNCLDEWENIEKPKCPRSEIVAEALESYANSRLEEAAQIFESLPPDGGRVKVEVVIESIRSLKSKEPA